ncbi:glycosyltransferase [Azospirillum doebereinerae]
MSDIDRPISYSFEQRLTEGVNLQRQGQIAQAKAIYAEVLAAVPGELTALYLLGVAERHSGNPLRALELISTAIAHVPEMAHKDKERFHALNELMVLAERHSVENRLEEAKALLEAGARCVPEASGAVLRQLATVHFALGNDAEAQALCALSRPDDGVPLVAGIREALAASQAHRVANDFVGTIVVPAYNAAPWIRRALESILSSIRYYRRCTNQAEASFRIVVVDDSSTDTTAEQVGDWFKGVAEAQTLLIRNSRNSGAAYSRNLGAQAGSGKYLWFLDADDIFFESHLYVSARGLELHPEAGMSRTGMAFEGIDDAITPEWRIANEHTYPCNLCIRRECHDFVGGFPEERAFFGGEDVGYSRWIGAAFLCAKTAIKTVQYTIRKGNVGYALKDRMVGSGAQASPSVSLTLNSKDMALELLIRRRLYALSARRGLYWDGPPILPDGKAKSIFYDVPEEAVAG